MDRCYIASVTTRWQQYLLGCVQWLSAFSVTTEEMVFLSASTFKISCCMGSWGESQYLLQRFLFMFFFLNEYLGKDEVMQQQVPFWSFS